MLTILAGRVGKYYSPIHKPIISSFEFATRFLSIRSITGDFVNNPYIAIILWLQGPALFNEIIRSYSVGRGTTWMYQKRIDDLVALKLVRVEGDQVTATPAGLRAAHRFAWIRNFMKLESEGG